LTEHLKTKVNTWSESITDYTEEVVLRDNRDVFDDGTAQQLSNVEIMEARKAMSSKVGPESI
jgi:hypothetical protein